MLQKKKGVIFSNKYSASWATKFNLLNPAWHYSWSHEMPLNYPENVEYVPMLWGKNSVNDEIINYLKNLYDTDRIKYVLTFNEPDLDGQSNMTVSEAIEIWKKIETIGAPIGSPVTSSPSSEWFSNFMNQAKQNNLKVDFITVHIYDISSVENFTKKIDEIFNIYTKPIWITEFALRDSNADANNTNKYTSEDVLIFMQDLLPELEKRSHVFRYAWFDVSSDNVNYEKLRTSDLITENNELTDVGTFYSNYVP